MINLKEASDALLQYLKVQSHPLAIKYLQAGQEIPQGFMRPGDMGIKSPFCQINTIVRKWGFSMAVRPEDVNCAAALLAFGWGDLGDLNREEELVDLMVSGGYVADSQKARDLIKTQPFLSGESKFTARGILVTTAAAGLIEDPDVILIYGNPAQITRLIQSMVYIEGRMIESQAHFGLSCVNEIIIPSISKRAMYIVPGRGERQLGLAGDDEMVFALPATKLQDLLIGLKETDEKGSKYPIQPYLFYQPRFHKAGSKLMKKIRLT